MPEEITLEGKQYCSSKLAMASEVDQASPLLEEEQEQEQEKLELRNERQMSFKQLKSFEFLNSALKIITSNTKFMFFMFLSIVPFFVSMVFTEIKLQKVIDYAPNLLGGRSTSIIYMIHIHHNPDYDVDANRKQKESLFDIVQLCFFYLVLYPLFEIFSMIITIRLAAEAHAEEKQATLKEILNQKINNLKGLSVTYLCVHLLSSLTLLGLLWVVVNHCTFTRGFDMFGYYVSGIQLFCYIISIAFHSVIFIALLYKYLEWSASWNMSMVISVLEEETGIGAIALADYYGKHCKRTGFQLMLMFFGFGNVLRLSCLFAGLCNESVGGVTVTAIAIGLFCLWNLVKWVASVLYFYDCKQQTLEKKADEEVGKP